MAINTLAAATLFMTMLDRSQYRKQQPDGWTPTQDV